MMFTSIVVGTNWSGTAEIAVARAVELARLSGARLHVVSVDEGTASPVSVTGAAAAGSPHFQADVALEQTLERVGGEGVEIVQHTPSGAAADSIVAVAVEEGADLIVVGSKGMQGARRVLGSVPNKVSHHAPCDVLIVNTA
jgi:nucleotide-binding universal stress UspA family protein